ncbi:MAG TPA: class I adenylate-forming enzyme family protein [Spongiibacteraceae bacterium]|jgi:acyl-CoA synthetase (AMP-forming)/AMP-acid ligase II|nr:class I adenylate-forming enzyme family protein [Spongiibacteraceae bacterium]HUH36935.1 class I adenylate-forming enzyme family protein [Spongiibacteraceae bacterium]
MSDIVAQLQTATQQLTGPGAPFELVERTIDGIPYRLYAKAPATLREAMDMGRQYGEREFLIYESEHWSFDRFYDQADRITAQLARRYAIKKGDRVAIAMRNFPEWMTAYAGIVSLGAVVVPLNSWGRREELQHGLSDSGARLVFCDQQRLDHIAEDLQTLGVKAVLVRRENDHPLPGGAITLEDFLAGSTPDSKAGFEVGAEDPAMIMYTSGTTGKAKGALSSNRSIVQALVNFEFHAACAGMVNSDVVSAMMSAGHAPTSLLAVPLFHVSGCHAQFLLSLRGGRRIVMMYRWDPGRALELIEQYHITAINGAPKMVLDLLEHPDFDKRDTSSLFSIGGGGAASPPKYATLVKQKLKTPYPGAGYGMTESNASCANSTGKVFTYKPAASGTISPIIDVKTCDENGVELPRGETGEIWLRGPTVVIGYWNQPQATEETFVDGWLRTGDIGYVDDENYIFVVDRAKDIIIRGGENIAAAEIEGCLHNHPAVYDAAAFGVPHDSLGEELAVAVTLKPDTDATEEDIRSFVREHLAGFKVPSYVWLRREDFPRNPTGKPLKKVLREQYLALQQ